MSYTGEDAREELTEERREEKRENLKSMVDDQEVRVKNTEKTIERLEAQLETAKEARRTEKTSLEELEDTSIEDFDDINDVELSRDDEDAVTADDLSEGGNPFQGTPLEEVFSHAV